MGIGPISTVLKWAILNLFLFYHYNNDTVMSGDDRKC